MIDFRHHHRAQDCIAQSYLTNSKRPESLVKGVYPTHLARGQGAFVWDHKGNKYLDFICGLGTSLLGYANAKVNAAIIDQVGKGASLSLATHLELEAAEKLKEMFTFIDCVKWLKTGSEACSAAVRIARAATGRSVVFSEGYHGWHDDFVSLSSPAAGVPPRPFIGPLAWIDEPGWELKDAAAVIVEPVITDTSAERIEWLKQLRADCTKHGVVLIFDEVITGFRFPKFSVSTHFAIEPDLICLGKAIANGMPLACVGGKYAIMNGTEYFVSSTYAGETLSLAAAKETMRLLQTQHDLNWLWGNGQRFLDDFNALWPGKLEIEGYPTRGVFKGDPLVKALFWQETCKAGMLFGPSWFLSFPAVEETRHLMPALTTIVQRIRRGEVELQGEMPRSPFAQKVRDAQ